MRRDYQLIRDRIKEAKRVAGDIISQERQIMSGAEMIYVALSRKNKVLLCGNGGSAADCQHIAAEFVGRFEAERKGLAAIALTTDTSILTALGNDYSQDILFGRQVEALGKKGDVLIALSTSGNSRNVLYAMEKAREKKMKIIGFTGGNGGKMKSLADVAIIIPATSTAAIQQGHMIAYHIVCKLVEDRYK